MNAYDRTRELMADIERLLAELREQAIDGDPEMHQALRDATKESDPPCR